MSLSLPNKCMYKIYSQENGNSSIEINPIWRDYLSNRSETIYQIGFNSFLLVLQKVLNKVYKQEEKTENEQPSIDTTPVQKEFYISKEDKELAKILTDNLKRFRSPIPISSIKAFLPRVIDGQPISMDEVETLLENMPEIRKRGLV